MSKFKAKLNAVLSTKEAAKQQEAQKKSPTEVEATTNRRIQMDNKFPETNINLVKRLFARGEAFDSDGFITFFTDTYAEHTEGRERIAKGLAPKWSIAGPKWPINDGSSSRVSVTETVTK